MCMLPSCYRLLLPPNIFVQIFFWNNSLGNGTQISFVACCCCFFWLTIFRPIARCGHTITFLQPFRPFKKPFWGILIFREWLVFVQDVTLLVLALQWWSPAYVRSRRFGIHRVIPGMRARKTLKTAQLRHNMQKTSCDVPKNAYFPRSKHQLSGYFIETSRVQRLGILEITWIYSCP